MKNSIMKAMQNGQIVNMMYMAKDRQISERNIKVIKVDGESFQAYCFLRNTKRTFKIDSVLALIPLIKMERTVV
ncbi:hypothetical protein [Paenisporosarcina sp. TG-14]|uniref:hypothetical protein n=1 Tax=Paenisporosarcina sp. TG-14 TaxID=1231057 RepID=UPI00036CC5BC|nr:hypothetical protein [Paenisporosarcina sp. TG-14]